MLRRRPTNCRRKTDLRAISQPPYFFAPDYVSKFIRCRTDSSRDFAKVMGPRGDNIVIQLWPTPKSGNRWSCFLLPR
jgi:hypothetical protein